MIKKYLQYIKEADEATETQPVESTEKVDSGKYTELKDEVKSMIEKTIEKSGGEFKSFVDKFIKTPEDVKNFSKSSADGIVIGSAIVEKIQEISKKSDGKHNVAKFIKDFCEEMIANLNS